MTTLYVLCGLPGAGKSTWAALLGPGPHIATADDIRLDDADARRAFVRLYTELRAELAPPQPPTKIVVADTCALRRFERLTMQRIGREACAYCVLVCFTVDFATCRTRDASRPAKERARVDWAHASKLREQAFVDARREGWDRVRYV